MFGLFKKNKNKSHTKQIDNITNLSDSFDDNLRVLKQILKNDETTIIREFSTQNQEDIKACVIFNQSLANIESINENVILPLLKSNLGKDNGKKIIDLISSKILNYGIIEKTSDVDKLIGAVLYGDTILIVENSKTALIINTKGWKMRSITESVNEQTVRGPREAFTESIMINVSLIRRKVTNPDMTFKFRQMGKRTHTKICICYFESLVNPKIVNELNKRLDDINIDAILETGYIEEFIRDEPLSPFATIGNTERPDKVVANLLEGRIALLVDGTPVVIMLPFLFMEYFQVPEDYYSNFIYATMNRLLRYTAFFISTSLPAIYVALTTFHQEMIPTPLILSISASRDGRPFPTIVEALIMLLAFEILREGGVRLPTSIGTTISFVGAVVLGEAAVTAKLVSAPIVIIIALTGITNFLIPKMLAALNIVRLVFLFLSAFLGLYGYVFGVIGLFIHLYSMKSFGIPYMLDIGSLQTQDIKDTAIRVPWWVMNYRPKLINKLDRIRERQSSHPVKK